ncbi:STY1053 family phage-associated protein [Xenorhabdus eapokensis]|uniref:Bacteriophage protein n=1 Tax=Xenorhabdus eapokensis TaxID=1873482 RepID=A0A1Q5TQV9_9GAMM|nr:hypothetical protein [Xenorhabdus eapokensis]OKP02605.1 hypothetical protein Xedl_02256 [Xenorhabdus eapokensis]
MMKIQVHTPFRFTHDNGESETFSVGLYDVGKSVAQHWFVQAHAEIIDAINNTAPIDHESVYVELQGIIAERDTQIAELQQQLEERDNQIAGLILQDPKPNQTHNGGKNGGNKK